MKISVVIPVYNIENYLRECLDSIVNQSLDDIEIICVNDGSTDNSLDILKEYESADSRLKVITQENRGAGSARNTALMSVNGEYVYFMDGDDILELDALEKLYELAIESGVDFVMFKISNFNEDTGEKIDDEYYNMPHLKERVGEEVFNYDDVSDMALDLCVCPSGTFFKREFINDMEFPEGLLFEDNVFFTHAIFKADKIIFYDEFLYNRRLRPDSASAILSIKSLDTIEITNLLLDLCTEFSHPKHKEKLYYRIFHNIYNIFKQADPSQKEDFFERIKYEYLKNKEKWESDDYFANNLKDEYRHMFNCAIKSKNAARFEKCVDSFNKERKLKRIRNKIYEII